MQLHFSWTVLVTIIWTILLSNSAKGTTPKKTRALGLEKTPIGLTETIDTSWRLENTIKTIQSAGPNVETKSPSDITKRRIITGNDMAGKMVGNAVEKRHVREQSLSQETPISSKYGKNNENAETESFQGKDNDGDGIFRHRSKLSLKRNIPMTHYTNGGLGSSEKHQLNVPRELTTESVSLEHDNVVPNQASTKSSPYDEEEEAARPVRTSAIAVSLIDGSNSSGVNYQSLKSSLQTHTSKYRDSIDSKVSEGERSKEKTRFARDSSFNDDPSGKDQPFHKALFEAHTSGEHQDVSSPEPRDPLSFFKTHSETENIGKRKEDEETFIERGPYLLGKTSTMWEKQRDRNVPGTIRENSFVNGPLDSNEILEYEVNGETKSSQRRQDPSVSNELSNIEAADKQEVKKLPASAQAIQGNSEDSGFSVPTFFQIPENLLEKEANRVFESSGDVGSRLMASAKMSSESSKGLSKQIAGSPTHGIQTKMDSSTETPNDQDFPDGRHLGTPGSSSPETRQFYQQQKFKEGLAKINHLGDGKDEHGSPSVSSLNNKASDTKSDEARIIGGNKNRRNISKGLGLDDTENNVHGGWSMSQVSDDNRRSRWDQEFTDNPSSQDIKMKVHGEVVKTELTGLQRDRRAHKTFIGQNSVGDTNLGSYQTAKRQVLVQEPKKYRQKLTFDTTPIEVNGFLSLEEAVPSFQKTLVNSEASSSLWPEVKREKTLSDLNTKLSTDGTRKMELAGEDTQGAVNIRTFKDDEAGKEISLSEEPSKMGPRSMQFLQASSTENNTSSDDAVSNAENRGNSIQGIFQAVPTDTSLSMGSPRAKIYSRDFVSDRTDHHVHESDRNRHSEFLESKSQLDRELFYRATESDRREKVTSNFREKSDVRSVKTSNIHSSDMQSDKIQRAGRVNSAAENFETVSTAPKIGRDQIDDRFQNKTIQNHDHQRDMKIITSRKNYIGQVQTDETNAISIIDRSQLHDQIGSKKNDSLEKQRKRRNHSNDEIPKVVECDTCNIIEDVDTNGNGRTRTFHFVHHEERSNEKGARFVTETSVPKSLLPLEITREYGVPVDATVTDGPGNSLAATSSELEAIAHLEERVDERLRWKNIETLVRSQQKIAVESLANDFRSSRDPTSTLQPSAVNIGKLKDTDERNASADSMLDQSNGSSSSPNGEAETREVGPPGKKPASRYEKFEIRPSRSKEALANKRRKKFPDNGDDVSRDQGNFRPSSIPSKGNVSGNVNFVNTLVHQTDTTTTSTMSTMKIDSAVGLIDQTSHRLEFTRRKEYIDDAEPRIWPGGNSRAIGKMYNVRKKQIKRAFTENSTASVTDTKTTTRDSPDYKTSSTRRKDDISNAKSIEVSGDIEKTAKVTNKTLRIPVADWTMSNFSSTRNLNPIYSNSTSYSSNPNVNPIRNSSQTFETVLNQEQRLQPHQDHLLPADKMKESIDNRILNQTIHDNSTRVTNTLNQWPVKHSAVVEGDLVLGGLMMVHEREDSVTCGPVMPQGGVQALEAMLYTLDWVNKRDLVPGVKIGAHILDDCDKDTYGLEMAVDFIKGKKEKTINRDNKNCKNDDVMKCIYLVLLGCVCLMPSDAKGGKYIEDDDFDYERYHDIERIDLHSMMNHPNENDFDASTIDELWDRGRKNLQRRRNYREIMEEIDHEKRRRKEATSHNNHRHRVENPLDHHLIRHSDRLFRSIEANQRLPVPFNWPVKKEAVVEGDLILGGLMMVHEREDSITCGPVMPQGGVQALEAMLYTLDWINERNLVPGVKIGAHILDDCDKDTYGLEMAVDFIKGSISNIDGAEYHCNKTAVRKVISGVVGAASSVTSIQVANLLRLFRIPQVSFFSTSPELSNKMRFEYFTRTIPSDHYQVQAMVDIVLQMGWSYVSIIYEESNYGEKAYEELEKLLGKHQICIAVKEKLSKDSGVAEAHVYDNIVQKLLTKPRARGCIIFASDQEVAGVMRAVRRCNATGAFSWIGSDGWSARSLVSDGNEREMEGTLSVQPQANPVQGFEDYFLNLTVENNRRNPWFVEFWEDHFKCRYPNSSRTPYNNYTEECTTTERLTRENTAFEDQLQFVSDAVLAFAHAFRNMHSVLCHGKPGLCDAMKPTKGIELLNYLRNVEFDGLTGDVFHFDKNGDGPARYNIIHFKQISPGEYKWIRVGKYLEGELRLNMSEIQFRLGHPEAPESVCSLPCEVGQAKKYVEGESCCWHCFNCSQDEIRHISDEKQCVLCPKGTLPDQTHSYCRDIPEEFLRPESGWAIGAMSFSSTGILITLFVGGVFLKHNDTPIVRASGRELSYVLLTGILLCYLVTFALVLRPTDLVCSIQRFSAGFCFTVMYAALLTKTNRISRIFNAGKRSAKRPSFISPRSQLIICSMLVAVQILIHAVWMVIDPAKARHHYPTREDNLLVCNSYIDASYMIAFTYPIILIVVCTVYAVLTRKIPEAFNESKHIGFTMYTTCVIWLAFVPLYFATGSHVALRITSMSVTISLSATVTIACLFTPKLYIILIHPERNVRPNMMHHRYNTTKGSVVTATNASSMMAPVTLTAVTCDQNKAVKKHAVTTMDCSTQSEQFEVETKERQNGKIPAAALINRSTQTTLNNNGTDSTTATSPIIKDIGMDENNESVKGLIIGKIGNGPLAQNEVPL